MAIESEVFGRCVGEINVLVEIGNRYAWLCCEWGYLRFIWGGKSGSKSMLAVGDGARYWRSF